MRIFHRFKDDAHWLLESESNEAIGVGSGSLVGVIIVVDRIGGVVGRGVRHRVSR